MDKKEEFVLKLACFGCEYKVQQPTTKVVG